MVAFGHTAVGVLVGVAAYRIEPNNLPVGLLLAGGMGIISHYLTDLIPHGHLTDFDHLRSLILDIIFDLFLVTVTFLVLAYQKFGLTAEFFYVLFGIGGAQLPDVVHALTHLLKLPGIFKKETAFHESTHWFEAKIKPKSWSIIDLWQIILVIGSLILILKINP